MNHRIALLWASAFGFFSVAVGAFGAHGLKAVLDAQQMQWLETGSRYQMFHALALLATCALGEGRLIGWSRRMFVAGILIFSGSLYALAFQFPRWFGAIAPLGGTSLMLGWILLFFHASSFGAKKESR